MIDGSANHGAVRQRVRPNGRVHQKEAGMPHRKGFARLVVAALALTAMAWSAPADAAAKLTPVRAAYIPVVTWLPAWVAKEKGIFAAHGLDVTLTVAQNLSILPGAVGRQFDFAPSSAPDLLKAVSSGIDVAAVASTAFETAENPSTYVIVAKNSGIAGPKDLVGKLIATPTIGGVIHVSVLYWLKTNGVDPASVRAVEVPFPNMPDQLKAKRVDAVESLEPFAGTLRSAGNVSIATPLLTAGNEVLFSFWIAQGAWARENSATVAAWRASLTEAIEFIHKNPQAARIIMALYTKLPEPVVQATPFPTFRVAITAKDIAHWTDVMHEIGQLDKPVDPAKLVIP
jgi:NitT/TauT family transport system substrate-binding protein